MGCVGWQGVSLVKGKVWRRADLDSNPSSFHFLALGIQASLFGFGGSDSKESACNAGDPGRV